MPTLRVLTYQQKKTLFIIFKNKAYLKNLGIEKIITDLFGQVNHVLIVSMEVRGNDLAVGYMVINNFSYANLENTNFKNSDLKVVNFQSANLTNADLSGADLSNANLNGAILDGANLTCENHHICN